MTTPPATNRMAALVVVRLNPIEMALLRQRADETGDTLSGVVREGLCAIGVDPFQAPASLVAHLAARHTPR